jgi:phage terminase large subunit
MTAPLSGLREDGNLELITPRAFLPLLKPARFKGARGGRGSAKSHFIAERMIKDCIEDHHRVACLREYQSSIKDSVKQLLEDKIRQFGHESKFVITDTELRGPNESLVVFKGLHSGAGGTAAGLQSLEGFSRAWVEEAQSISKRSLTILYPTFRSKPGALTKPELWFSWNPIHANDPIEVFFNENEGDQDFICVDVTYANNPWFEESGLRRDMERDRRRDSAKYAHVWLGEYLKRSEEQVFQDWEVLDFDTPEGTRFYFGADWGFSNDPTVLVRMWIDGNNLYIDYEAYQIGCKLDNIPALFMKVPGSKGLRGRPKPQIRADSARPETIDHLRDRGFNVVKSIKGKGSVDDGIEFLKNFHIIIHERCTHTIDEFSKYSWKVDPKTDEILPVLVDKDNHVIDSCIAEGSLITCERGDVPIEQVTTDDRVWTRAGWKCVLWSGRTGSDRELVHVSTTVGDLYCTPDHKVWTAEGFARADAICYAMDILGMEQRICEAGIRARRNRSGLNAFFGMITSIGAMTPRIILDALLTVRGILCISTSGSLTTVPSLPVMKSTTLMKTPPITRSRISSVLPPRSIKRDILLTRSATKLKSLFSNVLGHLPRPGMQVRKGMPSMSRLGQCLARILFRLKRTVCTVKNYLHRYRLLLASSVLRHVNVSIVKILALITRHGSAKSVELASSLTSTPRPRLVRGRVLTVSYGGRSAVYDLTIEDQHEFFADGVLVHNCRYGLEQVRHAGTPLILSPKALRKFAGPSTHNRFPQSQQRNRFARVR